MAAPRKVSAPRCSRRVPYDANGQPLASTLMDYLLPGPSELPHFRINHTETLSPHTTFGIKGVGEGGAIAPAGGHRQRDQRRAVAAWRAAQ